MSRYVLAWIIALSGARARGATTMDAPSAARQQYADFARAHQGDAGRGRVLFADEKRLRCVQCHRVQGAGGAVGPDLTDVAGKYDRPQFIESVLDPSRAIVDGYRPTTVATKSGRVLTGIVKEETAAGFTLVDAEGRRHSVRAGDVEERKPSAVSLMPDGLAGTLSPEHLALLGIGRIVAGRLRDRVRLPGLSGRLRGRRAAGAGGVDPAAARPFVRGRARRDPRSSRTTGSPGSAR